MNHWRAVDQLLRELGGLRAEANRAYQKGPELEAQVASAVEDAIRQAADAVDRTIDADDDEILVEAWEAILVAQETVAGLRVETARARQNVIRSVDLRRAAAKLMVTSMGLRRDG
jgi:hypothetical protein